MKAPRDYANAATWIDSKRYLKLTPFEDVLSRIESYFTSHTPKTELIRIDRVLGRISAENAISHVEIPPRTTAAMDGYAVAWADLKSASPTYPMSFAVRGGIYPDHFSKMPSIHTRETYYVATGAPLPLGTDVVVRIEEARPNKNNSVIEVRRATQKGKNIAKKGEDIRKGQIVVRKGTILSPVDVALLIGVGKTHIAVYKTATVGLLSVGNELREFNPRIGRRRKRGHITNNYLNLISGYVQQFGSKPVSLGTCSDEMHAIRKAILLALKKCDMVLTISGSSVGRHDNVLDALTSLGNSSVLFHGTRVVPIRPSGVVIVREKPVIIVPGHAVSAVFTFFTIGLPILNILSGLSSQSRKTFVSVETTNEITNQRAIDALSLVKLEPTNTFGKYKGMFLDWGSNLLSNLSKADGFVWLSPHQTIPRNRIVPVELFNQSAIAKSSWSYPLR